MKIKTEYWGVEELEEVSIYVDAKLVKSHYSGAMECLADEVRRLQIALGYLCNKLADCNLLTAEDIVKIVGSDDTAIELIKDDENANN